MTQQLADTVEEEIQLPGIAAADGALQVQQLVPVAADGVAVVAIQQPALAAAGGVAVVAV